MTINTNLCRVRPLCAGDFTEDLKLHETSLTYKVLALEFVAPRKLWSTPKDVLRKRHKQVIERKLELRALAKELDCSFEEACELTIKQLL